MRNLLWGFFVITLVQVACAPAIPTATAASADRPTVSVQVMPSLKRPLSFDGEHAYQTYFLKQLDFGPHPAGSVAARAVGDYIITELKASQWETVTQEFVHRGVPIRNVVGMAAKGRGPVIVIGAHYDTRPRADQDKTKPDQPVPGANDGASGVAVLLELARVLDVASLKNEVWLAFFDAEDNGQLPGCSISPAPCGDNSPWPWSVGATYMAEHLTNKVDAVVIVDMIGDKDQNIYYEQNSDKELQEQLWGIAARLGYSQQFIPEFKWSLSDDHTPFVERGIRAVDIIDFDYPYWHTVEDTADKVSAASLERVGRVVQVWLEGK